MQLRFLAAAAALLCAPAWAAQHGHHWSYEGDASPAHWGSLAAEYAVCADGKNQSPVDLSSAIRAGGDSVRLAYAPMRYRVENNGHAIQVTPATEARALQIGDKSFVLKQFHFHTPSEHTFKGRHFPMEAHFVHQTAEGELAVVAVVFEEGAANPALKPLLTQSLQSGRSVEVAQLADITPLLPADQQHFRLNGSLTTPPCSEGVNWVVMKTPVSASKAQIRKMAAMIGHANNRPVQPLNSRIVVEEAQ